MIAAEDEDLGGAIEAVADHKIYFVGPGMNN